MISKANQKQSARHKTKYAAYLTRSTCTQCRLVFRSPKKRLAHVESGHKSTVGVNPSRAPKAFEPAFK